MDYAKKSFAPYIYVEYCNNFIFKLKLIDGLRFDLGTWCFWSIQKKWKPLCFDNTSWLCSNLVGLNKFILTAEHCLHLKWLRTKHDFQSKRISQHYQNNNETLYRVLQQSYTFDVLAVIDQWTKQNVGASFECSDRRNDDAPIVFPFLR